ncbi:MAG: hormogonium polysaccharide biosynthesis glycosyltransferase HpsE [Microcoleaceae cyanobacterium]
MDLTVAICTYNGENRVPEVLEYLQQQVHTEAVNWEILVVDNNSTDQTAKIIDKFTQNWQNNSKIRYIFEPQQGTTYARKRAIKEAKSELVAFLDDDNLPNKNWVYEVYQFSQENPKVGAYGGNIHAKLDQPPPPYFDQVKLLLAIHNRGDKPFCYARSAKPRKIPVAPGSVIRKTAWREAVPTNLLLQGRDEKHQTLLGACEDLEVMYYIQNSDWEVWHNPKMEIWHHIPSHRLKPEYLLKISRTSGYSNHALRLARMTKLQRYFAPLFTGLYLVSDGYKLVSYKLKNSKNFHQDIGQACEYQSRIGRFLSPFIVWMSLMGKSS